MRISVTFRNTEGEEWMKEYVEDKLKKLKKYIDNPVEAHVILSVEKFRNCAEINLSANGLNINSREEEKDMHLAVDNAIEKIERQLKKRKERIRDFKPGITRGIGSQADTISEDSEDLQEGKVVETREIVAEPMAIDDALMRMDASKNRLFIYRDFSTENVCVLYRRDDGRYELIVINQ